ncbi:MAG TPA: hypothetical protein VIM31_03410 [Candidatus Microsaccharimonas sp.]|jgi:hypothetical protein
MKKLRNIVFILGIALGIGLTVPASAYAAGSVIADQCVGVTDSAVCKDQNAKPSDLISTIVNTLLFIIGALSVVMIIVGGIFYVTSNGDSGRVTLAKNTITYAIVGLVVAFLAFAIVQFVITKFT